MKRFGYTPAFAGGVEATATMGGQIMPPVMGAVAFIMAETIDVPYVEIVQGGDHPGPPLLRHGLLDGASRGRQARPARPAEGRVPERAGAPSRERWYLILPLAALVYLLFSGYTPLFAGTVGLALTVVLILGTRARGAIRPVGLRILFWILDRARPASRRSSSSASGR